ncbi:MAG: hypothetical protein R2851_21725 [Caldilineaceae bacterium]
MDEVAFVLLGIKANPILVIGHMERMPLDTAVTEMTLKSAQVLSLS